MRMQRLKRKVSIRFLRMRERTVDCDSLVERAASATLKVRLMNALRKASTLYRALQRSLQKRLLCLPLIGDLQSRHWRTVRLSLSLGFVSKLVASVFHSANPFGRAGDRIYSSNLYHSVKRDPRFTII